MSDNYKYEKNEIAAAERRSDMYAAGCQNTRCCPVCQETRCCPGPAGPIGPMGPTGATAPSIYAQQGKCRNHAAFSTLKTIKQPL